MEERASLENPATPITGCNVGDVLEPGAPAAGVRVTPATAWNYTAVYAAIRLLSETVAQLPLHLYRRTGSQREKAIDHPLYRVVANSPAPNQTSFTWRETQMAQALTWGNGFAAIERVAGGGPVRTITVLPSDSVAIVKDTETATIYYRVVLGSGRTVEYRPDQILHVPAMSIDGVVGVSPITAHREALGLTAAAQNYGSTFFGRGQSFGGVLTHPSGLSRQAKETLKNGMEAYRGRGYNGTLILDEGMDFKTMGIPPEDAQFLETRRFQVSEIARIFNIPPHMLRDLEKSSFNNIEQQGAEYLRYTMSPWLVKWEQELSRKLLTEEEQGEYYFKFSAAGLLRGTQKDRYDSYGRAILDGWMSRNEVRELEDLNPVDGLDDYLQPLNMAAVGDEPEEPASEEPPAEEEDDQPEDEQPPEDEARARFSALITQAAESYGRWISDTEARATDHADLAQRLSAKLPAMGARYIHPVLIAAGVERSKAASDWDNYIKSAEMGKLPTALDISTELERIIWGDGNG